MLLFPLLFLLAFQLLVQVVVLSVAMCTGNKRNRVVVWGHALLGTGNDFKERDREEGKNSGWGWSGGYEVADA